MQPDEPERSGLTFNEVRQMGPKRMEFRSRVAELVPNERMEIESLTGSEFHGRWAYRRRAAARGCAGRARCDHRAPG